MVKTVAQLQDIDSSLETRLPAIVQLSKVAAPYTTIVNRANVTDFSKDLLPRFGIDRVMIQQLVEVQGEYGPSGQRVFKPVNDVHDAVRFVGGWLSAVGTNGSTIYSGVSGSYAEFTFYGTGLNLLVFQDASSRDFSVSVDGGGSSTISNTGSDVIQLRNYSGNAVINVASALTLGMHTVKITTLSANNRIWFGYEVLNTSTTLQLVPGTVFSGGERRYASALTTTAYNSGFESGTLGTRGGHVLVYQKADGTIAKAVTPTNASAAYLASADHTNEEVARVYHWREFGAGRADDFSSVTTSSTSRAFTLDDGTVTLVGSQIGVIGGGNEDLGMYASGAFFTLTFVGTGLDIVRRDSNTTALDQFTVLVDGSSAGTITGTGNTSFRVSKICSGLPYGTHTVKITRDAFVNAGLSVSQFIVYAPKKPTLPNGAVALADYFVMADFAANATASIDHIATGVLRKASIREQTFVNGTGGTVDWSIAPFAPSSYTTGTHTFTDRQNAYFEYTFFGTGFEHRFASGSNRSASIQISLQNLSSGGSLQNLTTTNFPSLVSSTYGTGITFTAGTGIYDQNDASSNTGCGLRISGLPLALYKVRFLNNSAGSFVSNDAFDVITPIHAPKLNGPFVVQNTLAIGSCAVGDLRNFGEEQIPTPKFYAQAIGVTSGVNNNSSTTFVPMQDMSLPIYVAKDGFYSLGYSYTATPTGASSSQTTKMFLNGSEIGVEKRADAGTATSPQITTCDEFVVKLARGYHKLDVYWRTNGTGNATSNGLTRNMTVREV